MEKMLLMRSLHRSICRRSIGFSAKAAAANHQRHYIRQLHFLAPSFPASSRCFLSDSSIMLGRIDCQPSLSLGIGSKRFFSEDVAHLPVIKDPEIERVFKDIMAASWDDLPPAVVHDTKKALSKSSDDKVGHEALLNAFRAAEAVEEFTGTLMSLKMEIDDSIGLSGEDVKPLPEEYVNALRVIFQRYNAYLEAFGPEESYLKKKVENELGTRMIYLKMRCSGLDSEWGKVSVLGTSGLAGSYVEQRA